MSWGYNVKHSNDDGLFCLFIGFADESHVTYISPDQVKDIGEEVILNCTVKNPKKYYVSWVKDRSTISLSEILAARSDRFEIKHDNSTDTFSLHVRKIKSISPLQYLIDKSSNRSTTLPHLTQEVTSAKF